MPTIKTRQFSARIAWQLEQQGLPALLARLYAARGIKQRAELNDDFKALIAPAQLKNATEAALLLADAFEAHAKILIIADYDCDGATACAVGVRAMRAMLPNAGENSHDNENSAATQASVDYLVPNRFTFGYGLTPEIVDFAASKNPDLIVTVDNGIASLEGVARANELGISVLITDHHLPAETLPSADCIVNPNQPGCPFPSKNLAGVGVMFYVMLALRAELRQRHWFQAPNANPNQNTNQSAAQHKPPEPNLAALLDLVALGTVADVVALDQNNRILVKQGLKRMREGRLCCGIQAIFAAAGRSPLKANSMDLGFIIGPRLNAAGRLEDMSLGIECLLTDDPARALALAQQLDTLNRTRKDIEADMQEQALQHLNQLEQSADPAQAAIALFDPSWHQGVIGILASRIKDRLHRPVFAFAPADLEHSSGQLKGSGRSIPGFHLRDALDLMSKRAPGLLLRFGGHAMAAGASIKATDFARFAELFSGIAEELLSSADLTQTIETDGSLASAHFSTNTAHLLNNEIWGQAFPAPLFEDEFIVDNQRILKEKHLKMRLRKEGQAQREAIDALWFNFKQTPSGKIRAVYRLAVNEYKGIETPQLLIEEIINLA